MSGPRIVFSRFLSVDSPKLSPWTAHRNQVIPGIPAPNTHLDLGDGVVVWQLVSANNRPLARSVALHGSFHDADDDARGVVFARANLASELVSQPSRGSYGWYTLDGDRPVMVCARWYLTPRDRAHSIALALRSLGDAQLHPGVRLIHQSTRGGAVESLPA
jgi:hypothetical protein